MGYGFRWEMVPSIEPGELACDSATRPLSHSSNFLVWLIISTLLLWWFPALRDPDRRWSTSSRSESDLRLSIPYRWYHLIIHHSSFMVITTQTRVDGRVTILFFSFGKRLGCPGVLKWLECLEWPRVARVGRVPYWPGTCASRSVPALVAGFLLQGPIGVLLETFLVGDSITPALLSHRGRINKILKFLNSQIFTFQIAQFSVLKSSTQPGDEDGREETTKHKVQSVCYPIYHPSDHFKLV